MTGRFLCLLPLLTLHHSSSHHHPRKAVVQDEPLILNLTAAKETDIVIPLILFSNTLQFIAERPNNCLNNNNTIWTKFYTGSGDDCVWEMDWHEDGLVFGKSTCVTIVDVEIILGNDRPLLLCPITGNEDFHYAIDLVQPCNLTITARISKEFWTNFTIMKREEGSECDEILIRFESYVYLDDLAITDLFSDEEMSTN